MRSNVDITEQALLVIHNIYRQFLSIMNEFLYYMNIYILIIIPTFHNNSGKITNKQMPIQTDGDFLAIKIDAFICRGT